MNIVRNAVDWYIIDTVSTRNSKRLMQEIAPSQHIDADTIGLSFSEPSYLLFMRRWRHHEIWWREGEHWDWEPICDVGHIWGVEYERS